MNVTRTRFRQQRGSSPARTAIGLFFLLLCGAAAPVPAGQQPVHNPWTQHQPFDTSDEPEQPSLAARQLRAMNVDRQKTIVSDTDKLLKLAQELNSEIETTPENELTPMQVRKIADIERLAKNVKQKMSISLVGGPTFHDPIPTPIR